VVPDIVVLIGMPGCGKSTAGRLLARKLNREFIDTDDLIRGQIGMTFDEYINAEGAEAFAREERSVLMNFNPTGKVVAATGGSAVLYDDAMRHLKSIGTLVFIDMDLPRLKKRIRNFDSRGIIGGNGKASLNLLDVYKEREPLYYRYADVRVFLTGEDKNGARDLIYNSLIGKS